MEIRVWDESYAKLAKEGKIIGLLAFLSRHGDSLAIWDIRWISSFGAGTDAVRSFGGLEGS